MKTLIRITLLTILFCTPTLAQDKAFLGIGASFNRSSNYDPSPLKTGDGGQYFAGAYVEAGAPLPLNLEMRALAFYNFKPELPTIFTRDEGASRRAYAEFHIRPELRFYLAPQHSGFARPFIAGGIDYFRQRFDATPRPSPLPLPPAYAYVGPAEPGALPASGLNPTLTFGAQLGEYNEASFTRLFPDKTILNASELQGYRVNYTFTKKLGGRFTFSVAGEADYVTFREAAGFELPDIDPYREHDLIFRIRAGFRF